VPGATGRFGSPQIARAAEPGLLQPRWSVQERSPRSSTDNRPMGQSGRIATFVLGSVFVAGCGSSSAPRVATPPAPPAPSGTSAVEHLEPGSTRLEVDQQGVGAGQTRAIPHPTGTGLLVVRIEWACAPKAQLRPRVVDSAGKTIFGDQATPIPNGFDGTIDALGEGNAVPGNPPYFVIWTGSATCSWHVRAIDFG